MTKGLFGFFIFSSLITHHSSLITPHSIFIIHHSSFKIPQFPIPTCLAYFTQLLITQFFYFFVRLIPVNWLDHSVKPTRGTHSPPFSLVSFPLHPYYSPKTQTRTQLIKPFLGLLKHPNPNPTSSSSTNNNSNNNLEFQCKNSRSLIRKIKVFLVLLDFLKDLILTTKATSALASASSTLPSQPSGADLPPFQPSGTDLSFSLPCRVGHGWRQYSSFHCRAMPRSLLLFFFLGFWFGLIWDWS